LLLIELASQYASYVLFLSAPLFWEPCGRVKFAEFSNDLVLIFVVKQILDYLTLKRMYVSKSREPFTRHNVICKTHGTSLDTV